MYSDWWVLCPRQGYEGHDLPRLKVNTNHVRTTPLDGAKFPHIIHFAYTIDGKEYTGSRFVNWYLRCPVKDEIITVYYDAENPAKYAVLI